MVLAEDRLQGLGRGRSPTSRLADNRCGGFGRRTAF
jgi:hypothetical protein